MSLFSSKKKGQGQLTRRELVSQRNSTQQAASASLPKTPTYKSNRSLSNRRPRLSDSDESDRQVSWNMKKRRRKALAVLGVVVGVGLVIVGVLYQLTAYITIETTDLRSQAGSDKYVKIFEDYLSKYPAERLRFAIDSSALHGHFLEHAPEVKTIRVAFGGSLATTKLQLSFREPTVQWSAANKTYYVDESGVTFETSYYDNPSVIVSDQSGVIPQAGHEVIDKRFLGFLGQAVSRFADSSLPVSGVVLPVGTIRQVEFNLEDIPYKVKMTVDREAEAQVQQAIHAINFMKTSDRQPEYIDVRTNQQVFYR